MGGEAYTEKAFINALFFDCSKSRKLEPIVKDKATGRCPIDVFISILLGSLRGTLYSIKAWALHVARQTIGAMRDALSSETSSRYSTRASFLCDANNMS